MKDESLLDSAGPVTIIVCLFLVVGVITWVMAKGNGDWGKTTPRSVVAAPAESH